MTGLKLGDCWDRFHKFGLGTQSLYKEGLISEQERSMMLVWAFGCLVNNMITSVLSQAIEEPLERLISDSIKQRR